MRAEGASGERNKYSERGVALPLILFFVVVLTGLATIVFEFAVLGLRAERLALDGVQALAAGERSAFMALRSLPLGFRPEVIEPLQLSRALSQDSSDLVLGVGPDHFLVVSARRGPVVGILAKRDGSEVKVAQAVRSYGELVIGPEAVVEDGVPSWCVENGVSWEVGLLDPLPVFYDIEWWRDRITKDLPPGVYSRVQPTFLGQRCLTEDPTNWGAPGAGRTDCDDFRPTVAVSGDLVVSGGAGQGVLLVEGDLILRGGFRFDGLIVVKGAVRFYEGGGTVVGALVVHGNSPGASLIAQGGVSFSPCTVARMVQATAPIRPIERRSWIQLF